MTGPDETSRTERTDLDKATLGDYLKALSARAATPGGGAVAALNAAEAVALMMMVAEYSGAAFKPRLAELGERRDALVKAAEEDMAAFKHVMKHWNASNAGKKSAALIRAANAPRQVVELCDPLAALLEQLHLEGNQNLASDVAIAADLLRTALFACDLNMLINLSQLDEKSAREFAPALAASGDAQAGLAKIAAQVRQALTP